MDFLVWVHETYQYAKICMLLFVVYLFAKKIKKYLDLKKNVKLSKWNGTRSSPSLKDWASTYQYDDNTKFIKCFDPGNMESLCEDVPCMSADIVKFRIKVAHKIQKEIWGATNFNERRIVLNELLKKIIENKHQIAVASCRDSGKTLFEAYLGEVLTTCEKIRYIVEYGEEALQTEQRRVPLALFTKKAQVEYHPLGVIGMIVPWNYPFHNILGSLVTALYTGNAVVIKVSEWVTWSLVHVFEDIIHSALIDCGYSPDIVQFVIGYGDAGEAVIRGGVDHVFFIGSPETGKRVMRAAADTLTPVTLELGGKDPFIICQDANYDIALEIAVRSIFINCGQNCVASERFYVHEDIYEKFVKDAVDRVKVLRQGHPDGGRNVVDCGAMTMTGQIEKIEQLVKEAVNGGAQVRIGGQRNIEQKGQFYKPTIITGLTPEMRICKEECFGPVMLVIPWRRDQDVIEMANSTEFGLGSYVFSKDYKRAHWISSQLVAGVTMVNDYGLFYLIQSLPFGGAKTSGFGKFGGVEGLRAFCRVKSFVTDRFAFQMAVPAFISYPTREDSHKVIAKAVDLIYGWRPWALIEMLKIIIDWPKN
ncbi:aldehyde dehydrogenase [Acrasis kona]|uniref:Aldehyde dehydrogenase n=1 Tax=Acrasis kona TaxID=1008807 RepID=A0AAW2ZEG5_9EUKA